ncbi:MAG: hypothetical protein WC708_05435 [Lentisphaeria bacterium]
MQRTYHHLRRRLAALGGDRGGAVLMELVIAIPLFVALLGGTMWLGELVLGKQKLVASDRYAAWNRGNRHEQPAAGTVKSRLQNLLFPQAKVGDQPINGIREMAGSGRLWSEGRGATVVLQPRMPEWVRGWLRAGVTWGGGQQPASTVTLLGRDVEEDGHHRLVSRTHAGTKSGFPRNWSARALADEQRPWAPYVQDEPWPENVDTITASGWSYPGAPQGYRHQPRYRQYITWSK